MAAMAGLILAGVDAMPFLIAAGLPVGIDEVGDGGAAQADGFAEHALHGLAQAVDFLVGEIGGQARGMQARPPQAFVSVDISNAAQDALIEQQRFDSGATARQTATKFLRGNRQRVVTQAFAQFGDFRVAQKQHLAEAANVGVTQLAAVVELEIDMRVCGGAMTRQPRTTSRPVMPR